MLSGVNAYIENRVNMFWGGNAYIENKQSEYVPKI